MANPYSEFYTSTEEKPSRAQKAAPKEIAPKTTSGNSYSEFYTTPTQAEKDKLLTKEDYAAMPWSEIYKRGKESFLPSAGRAIMSIPQAIMSPGETAGALKQMGLGAAGKLGLYKEQDPQKRAQQEALVEAMVEPLTATYHAATGDTGELKKILAEDPSAILSLAATPFGGGLAKGAQLVGEAGLLGRTLGKIGKVGSVVLDPSRLPIEAAAAPINLGLGAARRARAIGTGLPQEAFDRAFEAGAAPAGHPIKEAFNQFASGEGDVNEFSKRTRNATEALRKQQVDEWKRTKGAMTGAATQDIPFDTIADSIKEERRRLGPRHLGMDEGPHQALDAVEFNLLKRQLEPAGSPARKLEGLDQLKQQLYAFANKQPDDASRSAVLGAHAGVRNTLNQVAPDYQDLMDHWRGINDQITNIQKTLGTGNKTAANAELSKFIKAQKTPQGRDLVDQLSRHDPTIPYMAAGASLVPEGAQGLGGIGQQIAFSQYMPQFLSQLGRGELLDAGKTALIAGGHLASQSPALARKAAYGAGALSQYPGVETAMAMPEYLRKAGPAFVNIERAKERAEELSPPIDVPARKSGGRAMTAQQMMSKAKLARKKRQSQTKAILEHPDERVVSALKAVSDHI